MQLLNQSAFLQSLGWAIANSLWQMAALWLCYQLFIGISKKASAYVKNICATALLFAGSGWFFYGFISKYSELQNEIVLVLQADKLQDQQLLQNFAGNPNNFDTFIVSAANVIEKYLPYLSTAYLLVFGFLFIRLMYAWNQSRLLKTQGLIKADTAWASHFNHLIEQAGLQKKITLWLSERIDVPATLGFLKPVVLLPVAALNQLTTEQVETILLHELAHIKRNDYLVNLFVAIAETILFFNPFAVLLTAHLKKERENSCDDFVLHFRNLPETYARALLVLEQNRIQTQPLLLKATGDGQLLHRVKRIMNVPVNNFNYGQRLLAFLVTAGILSSLAWIKPVTRQKQTVKQTIKHNSIASTKGANKIILSPSSIEKRPGGDYVLFDDKKKNSLLVKVSGNKVKLVDEINHVEIAADELDFDKFEHPGMEALEAMNHTPLVTPLPAETKNLLPKEWNNQEFNGFQFYIPAEITKAKLSTEKLRRELNRKRMNWQWKNELQAIQMNKMAREWEQLPTREDWQKLEEEIDKELAKVDLQLTLNELDLQRLDSVMNVAGLLSNKRRVNFNAAKQQKEQQLKAIIRLKELSNAFNYIIINEENNRTAERNTAEESPEPIAEISNDTPEQPVRMRSNPGIRYKASSPQSEFYTQKKKVKRPAVIVSL